MRILHPLVLLLATAAVARAGTTYPVTIDPAVGLTVQLTTPLTAVPAFGYLPLRLQVANSSSQERTWRFQFRAGQRNAFPGELGSSLEVTVPAGGNRDTWFYVPLAEPGVIFSRPGTTAVSANTVPAAPPAIAGIFPGPAGTRSSFRITRTVSSGATIERTFVITQTGPAALLPAIPEVALPARTTMTLTPPSETGEVRRTTTMTVVVLQTSASGGLGALATPTDPIVDGVRQKLLLAGLLGVRGTSASSSARTAPATTAGMSVVTVTFRQTGPTESLPRPPDNQVPPGFEVEIAPGPMAGTTMRSFIYRENIATATLTAAATRVAASRGGVPAMPSTSATETAAREKLAASGMLTLPPGVTQTIEYVPVGFPYASGPVYIVLFVQTGPASALPRPAPARVPPDVIVNVHPGAAPGQAVRTISYVDSATLATLAATVTMSASFGTVLPLNFGRVELARYGFLRPQAGVQFSGVLRSPTGITASFGGTGTASPGATGAAGTVVPAATAPAGGSTMIITESGPARFLPSPAAASLPPGATANVTPGAIAGEVVRNFVLPVPGGGLGGGIATATMSARPATEIAVEISGPGLDKPVQVSLADTLANAPASTPPLAIANSIEAPLRAKLSGLRGAPNLATVDPSELPADWRVWSPFHGVVLRVADYVALDPPRRAALRAWVAQGGQLFLVPVTAEEDPPPPQLVGAGAINTLVAPLDDLLASDLGGQLRLDAPALSLPPASGLARFEEKSTFAGFVTSPGASNTWLLVFTLGFAALVGPMNLFLMAKGKGRHRVFVTTPLIAVGGALTLGAAIVLQDGFGGDGVRTAVVALLPEDNAAVVFQDQAARTGLLGSPRFPIDEETVLTGIPLADYNPAGRTTVLSRHPREADGDWFRNRWRTAHHLRRVAPTRGRVDWVGAAPSGAPIVTSTLPTTLQDFVYLDDAGDSWSAREVPPGRPVTLARAGTDVWTGWIGEHFNGSKHLESVLAAVAPKEPRHWMATGGGSDLAPIPTLDSIRWTSSTVIYTGTASGAGRPGGSGGAP